MKKSQFAVIFAAIALATSTFSLSVNAQETAPVIGDEIATDSLPLSPEKIDSPVIGDELPSDTSATPPGDKLADPDKPKTDLPEATTAEGGAEDGAGEIKDDKLPHEASLTERMSLAQAEIKALQADLARNSAAIAELRMLIEEDREAEPRPAEDAPPIVVSCNDDPDCMACMAAVSADLQSHLVVYETLRAIYTRFTTFQKRVTIIGDMLAGFHSVSQNAWGGEKLRMQEQLAGLQRAYDAKLAELVTHLRGLMTRVEECHPPGSSPAELALHQRLFISFMSNAYRRTD